MASQTEQILSRSLRSILAPLPIGAYITHTDEFTNDILGGLEWWLPNVLEEIYSEWTRETLDGVVSALARKTADDEAEIFGAAYLIYD